MNPSLATDNLLRRFPAMPTGYPGSSPACEVVGCTDLARARGWCQYHYAIWYRHGDATHRPRPMLLWPENLLQRMEVQPNGCVYFTGQIDEGGYGNVWDGRHKTKAHRAAYEYFVGGIPDAMTVDHECHNRDTSCQGGRSCLHRRCINPDHLAVKTAKENNLASPHTVAAINAAKTHCKRGHEFTPENTRIDNRGMRQCRTCRNAGARRRYADRKAHDARQPLR